MHDFKNVRFNIVSDNNMMVQSSRRTGTETNCQTGTGTCKNSPFNKLIGGSASSMITQALALGFQGKSKNKIKPRASMDDIVPLESQRNSVRNS